MNAKNVKIAYASVKTEIIDDMLYIVLEDGRKIELPLYAEWCDFDRKGNVVIPISWGTLHVLNRNCIIRSGDVTLYTRGQTIPLDKVYVCAAKHDKRVYLIVKRSRKYAVVRDDGTFASDFKFTFEQAKQFVDIQFDGHTIIGKMV